MKILAKLREVESQKPVFVPIPKIIAIAAMPRGSPSTPPWLGKVSAQCWASQRQSPAMKSAASIVSSSLCAGVCRPRPGSRSLTRPALNASLSSKTANFPWPHAYGAGFAISQMASSSEVRALSNRTSLSSRRNLVTNAGAPPRTSEHWVVLIRSGSSATCESNPSAELIPARFGCTPLRSSVGQLAFSSGALRCQSGRKSANCSTSKNRSKRA
jgi:hypothetical protein